MFRSMTIPSFIRLHGDAVLLSIKLQPRASTNGIADCLGDELRIRVTAPPVDAAANEALVRFLSKCLDCPRNHVQLVRGHASRHKTVKVFGMAAETVLVKLDAAKA